MLLFDLAVSEKYKDKIERRRKKAMLNFLRYHVITMDFLL